MPNSVIFAFCVEMLLIALSVAFLLQPVFLFRPKSVSHHHVNRRSILKWGGVMFLFLTFCWSIIFGIVLSINEMSFKI